MKYLYLSKDFYNLKELELIVDIKYRQLLDRVKKVHKEFMNEEIELIFKRKNIWYIHKKLVCHFEKKRKPIEYSLFITISSKNQFEKSYWIYIINQFNKELKKLNKGNRIKYVIETNKNDINHLHFITNYDKLRNLKRILSDNILTNKSNDMNINIKYVYEIEGLNTYFKKQNQPVLLK